MRFFSLSLLIVCAGMVGCHAPCKNNLPPASAMMHPGPGVDGPGPGVSMYQPGVPSPAMTSQIAFVGPEGMSVAWDVTAPGAFDSEALTCPARYNFPQGAIYRLKMSNIPGRPGIELYPTIEVGSVMPRTEAFLAHNAIPVQFTPEDFDQVLSGNFVTKVIYLPDPEFQELALAGVDTLVSTRLDPGVDPIVEADRRGAILAIVRLGNKDLQAPGGQAQEGVASASYQSPDGCPQGAGGPMPMAMSAGHPSTMPMGGIAGVTAPQYGSPMCGTPIGIPGPPSVPLGVPAGLQQHTMVNHTRVCLPKPTDKVRVDVKQKPGISYPKPVDHVRIVERARQELGTNRQPLGDRHECVRPDCPAEECPQGATENPVRGNSEAQPDSGCPLR
jgi:hypothetical protein